MKTRLSLDTDMHIDYEPSRLSLLLLASFGRWFHSRFARHVHARA